jgi:hypothetical protein
VLKKNSQREKNQREGLSASATEKFFNRWENFFNSDTSNGVVLRCVAEISHRRRSSVDKNFQ